MRILLRTMFLLCLALKPIQAQADSLKHYILEGIVVTATRSEEPSESVGRSITVINEAEIKNSSCQNVGEILSRQEGIYMIGTKQAPGSIQNIFMRGSNSNHTLILIDGIPIADPSSVDHALDLSELSLANVERIEIVRGAHSTLYGSSAIGGAVNIITKKNQHSGFTADAGVQTGYTVSGAAEFSQNMNANYIFANGFYANAGILHTAANGINAAVDTAHQPGRRFDRDGFRKLDLTGKAGYKDLRWNIFGVYKRIDQKNDLDRGAYSDDPNYTINFQRNMWSYGAEYRASERLRFSFLGEYAATNRKAVNDSNVIDGISDHTYFRGNYEGTLRHNEFQANFNWDAIESVAGVGQYRETMSTKTLLVVNDPLFSYINKSNLDTLDIHSAMYDAYVRVNVPGNMINDRLNRWAVGIGGRLNHHSSYGENFTYDVNPSYRLTQNTLLFASYSTGYNAPSLYRLFTPETYYTSDIQRGNKKLKPETSVSYELGFKQTTQNLRLTVSLFYTRVKDYIDYVYLWDKNVPGDSLGTDFMRDDYRGDTYLNIGDQINEGVEAGIVVRPIAQLMLFGNITLIRGKLKYNPTNIDAEKTQGHHVQVYSNGAFLDGGVKTAKLIRRPNTGNIGVTYDLGKDISVTGIAQYTGSRRDVYYDQTLGPFGALGSAKLHSFWSVDVSANYTFENRWNLYAKIENIFNEKTTEIRGFRNRGRGVLLSLRYTL